MIRGYWQVSRRAWSFSQEAYRNEPTAVKQFKRHLRWSTLAALREAAASDWFTFLERSDIRPFVLANPRMAFRPMEGYMSTRWNWARRAKVIRDTYEFILAQSGLLQVAMSKPDGALLARLPAGKDAEVSLRLGLDGQFRKEGEVTLFLHLSTIPGPIYGLAFSIEHTRDGYDCLLGGFQGRRGGDEEAIKTATKALHGLRPKALMVFLAQEITRTLRLRRLLGVGNAIHIIRSRLKGPVRRILFDFDALWEEAGGHPAEDGWYELPRRLDRRLPEDVKPNKRAQYAKRYAFLETLSRQIKTQLTPFPRS